MKAAPKSMKNPMRLQNIDDHLFRTEICSYSWTPPSTVCAISELQEAILPGLEDMDPNCGTESATFLFLSQRLGAGKAHSLLIRLAKASLHLNGNPSQCDPSLCWDAGQLVYFCMVRCAVLSSDCWESYRWAATFFVRTPLRALTRLHFDVFSIKVKLEITDREIIKT